MEKTALILFPEERCDNSLYMEECIKIVEKEGNVPIINMGSKREIFFERMIPFIDVIYLFTNYGISIDMMDIIEKYAFKKELRYRKIPENNLTPSLKEILYDVCSKLNVLSSDVQSKSRKRELCDARFIYCYRARKITKESLSRIGKLINRKHCDVIHGIKVVTEVPELIKKYKALYEETPIFKKTMGSGKENPEPWRQEPRSILPYNKMEKGECSLQATKSVMCTMFGIGPDCAI